MLDVACGAGRHLQWFSQRGHPVTGIDRDLSSAGTHAPYAELIAADLENAPWPITRDARPREFGCVVVCNYLWRPLFDRVVQSVAPGGVLLYETFAQGNGDLGRPSRADFLLRPAELLSACNALAIVGYECGYLNEPPRYVQRIAAIRPLHAQDNPLQSSRCVL